VALLEKYCDHVNSRELEGSFQNPHFLIVISFFAPVVFALYEMAMHLIKLHADVVNAGGKFASSCLESAAAHARSCILRMLFVCTPARLQKSVANKVGEIKDSTTEQGLNAIDKQIVGHNEGLEEKSSEFQAQANEVFGIELNESEDTESATYEEYKLKQATDEEAREAEMAQSIGFALVHLGLALCTCSSSGLHKQNQLCRGWAECHVQGIKSISDATFHRFCHLRVECTHDHHQLCSLGMVSSKDSQRRSV
jgi:hypothetical protein